MVKILDTQRAQTIKCVLSCSKAKNSPTPMSDSASGEAHSLGHKTAIFSLCPLVTEGAWEASGIFYMDINPICDGSAFMTQRPPKGPSPNTSLSYTQDNFCRIE